MKEKFIKKGIKGKLFCLTLAFAMAFLLLPMNKIVANAAPTPLTFTAEEAGSSVTFKWLSATTVDYSTDGGSTWNTYAANTTITLSNAGDTVLFRGTDVKTNDSNHFTMTGKIAASGDVTSLTNGTGGDATLTAKCCYSMFRDCTSLTSAPALPATTLADYCYQYMFKGCTSLTSAPSLPATSLTIFCYDSMFRDCTSLTSAPVLPATTLKNACYQSMFRGCTSLTSAPVLSATTLDIRCYNYMFYGCASLLRAPALPATTLANMCYSDMFHGCTSLSSVPKLKATSLANMCYSNMFYECTNLIVEETTDASEATWIFPSTAATDWNSYMIDGLTAPGTLTAVDAGKMYKVSYVVPLPTPPAAPASSGSSANSYSETIDDVIAQLLAMAQRLANGEVIENPTVYFKSGDSLPLKVMQTLKKCSGVTLDFQCTYKDEAYHYALKGGEGLLIDETIPWYGPLYLQYMYGIVGDNMNATTNAPTTKIYTIKSGDSLDTISKELGISLTELLNKNPQIKDPNRICAGQLLNY